jgi:hypothetical protein
LSKTRAQTKTRRENGWRRAVAALMLIEPATTTMGVGNGEKSKSGKEGKKGSGKKG